MYLILLVTLLFQQEPIALPAYRTVPLVERNMIRIDRDSLTQETLTTLRSEDFFLNELNTHFKIFLDSTTVLSFKVQKNRESYYLISYTANKKIITLMHEVTTPRTNASFLMLGILNCLVLNNEALTYPDPINFLCEGSLQTPLVMPF